MSEPAKTGAELAAEIEETYSIAPTLWWLGHSGFAVKHANILFIVDPYLSAAGAPLDPGHIGSADLILSTHAHRSHMDGATLVPMLNSSRRAKLVLPKSAAAYAGSLGIPFERMTTTDSDLRVEYFKEGLYGRVYAIPSAHDRLNWTAAGGFPYLGYLIRFGTHTIYHAGDCVPYDGLVERLKPYNVTVALLPIGGRNFSVHDAAQLAVDIGARWVVPMHYDAGAVAHFIEHMLGQRPELRFKIFEPGEKWTIPDE